MVKEKFHESAEKHVTGEAVYVDDISVSEQLLYGKVVYSTHAHARIKSIHTKTAKTLAGVKAVLTAADIPGENQMGPVVRDEPCLAGNEVQFIGQAVALIAAESEEICREAERLLQIEYEPLPAVLTIDEAIKQNTLLGPERKIERGKPATALKEATHVIEGELRTGAQEHWYLETQAALCIPGEDEEMMVYSSTQHPSETQAVVAEVLGIRRNDITVEVRRLGGGFGGKETQANHIAAWTALLARACGRPVKIRLNRDDDQIMTGKRHPYLICYKAGFDDEGKILALDMELNSNGGATTDLSFAILERAMLHADNAYFIPNMRVIGRVWKTNLPPNTAMRGFGGPQAMAAIETVVDRIARKLGKDSAEVRKMNFYGLERNNITHYGEMVERNHLHMLFDQLMESSAYLERRKAIDRFNKDNEFYKKGLALTPVKFGISFTTSFLNQAGALVHIYQDGTVLVNHGGVEMGQGLHSKIWRIASAELGISAERIKLSATDTSKVPNTSATAASSGSDLNGMAVLDAINKLKERIAYCIADYFNKEFPGNGTHPRHIVFHNDRVFDPTIEARNIAFTEAVRICYLRQTPLSSTGFYRTPNIGFDRDKGRGRPFHYYAFGMAVSEVMVDTLTGYHEVLRTDILHDVGDSLHPAIDMGQIEGGFIQGVGWVTTEECKWDAEGHLLNHSPDTYKIPTISDIPKEFNMKLLEGVPNPSAVRKSKAVGEPPFMLALSVWLAIKDAVSAVANHKTEPAFSLPATNEVILLAIEKLKE